MSRTNIERATALLKEAGDLLSSTDYGTGANSSAPEPAPIKKEKKKRRGNSSGNTGLTKKKTIDKNLAYIMGRESGEASRTEVLSFIHKYIKEKGLQNPENRKQFIADRTLATIFQIPEGTPLDYFGGLQKQISKVIL